ncbi:MAG: SRPBCC family protein [Polyangiaceae bacterium]
MTAARPPGPKGRRYAYLVASAMSLFVLLACAAFAWRGLHASATLDYPKTSSQGVRCALVRDDAGNQPVRCAAVIDASPDAVWSVVTDYAHFGEIFETRLWKVTVESQSLETDGRTHLRGNVVAPYATYPFDVRITHELAAEKKRAAWDESDSDGNRTRGSWTVTPASDGHALVVYEQEVRARRAPRLVVVNLLLAQLGGAVKRIGTRVSSGKP